MQPLPKLMEEPASTAPDSRYQVVMARFKMQKDYYSTGAKINKQRHEWVQAIIMVLPAMITVLLTLAAIYPFIDRVLIAVSAVASAIVIIAAHMERQNGYGEKWLNYRMTAEALRQEETLFLGRAGRYRANETSDPIATFDERFVSLCEHETNAFNVSETRRQAEEIAQIEKALIQARQAADQNPNNS